MRMFEDERGYIITEDELHKEYEENDDKGRTFEEYVSDCCDKNGTLKEIEKQNYNVILSVEDSEKWKAFCIEHDIEWFRTEYGKDRYCQITATESEKRMVDHFLQYGLVSN